MAVPSEAAASRLPAAIALACSASALALALAASAVASSLKRRARSYWPSSTANWAVLSVVLADQV